MSLLFLYEFQIRHVWQIQGNAQAESFHRQGIGVSAFQAFHYVPFPV